MELDLGSLIALFTAGNAQAAAVGAVVLWAIQRFTSGKGFRLADILADLVAAVKPKPTVPAVPKAEDPKPGEADDLIDRLVDRLRDRFKRKVADAGGDEGVVVSLYPRIVSAIEAHGRVGNGAGNTADAVK